MEEMINEGADFIDIGGQSTRPGADFINADIELKRVIPTLIAIRQKFPDVLLSIDTFWSKVAKEAIENGAAIVNDISAGSFDGDMFKTVAQLKVPYVLMHMQGTPQTMQNNPQYNDVVIDVNFFFSEKISALRQFGVNDIILDPGFGFGKTVEQNYRLLKNLPLLGFGEFPLLIGASRKSMVNKVLNISAQDALNGTSVVNTLALRNGANILRVHDVKEAKEAVKIMSEYENAAL